MVLIRYFFVIHAVARIAYLMRENFFYQYFHTHSFTRSLMAICHVNGCYLQMSVSQIVRTVRTFVRRDYVTWNNRRKEAKLCEQWYVTTTHLEVIP